MDKAFWSEVSHQKATDLGIFMPQVQIQDVWLGGLVLAVLLINRYVYYRPIEYFVNPCGFR